MITIDDISMAVIGLCRLEAVFRFIYCMVRLQGAEEEQAQFKKRAKNTIIFYVIAERIWQIIQHLSNVLRGGIYILFAERND